MTERNTISEQSFTSELNIMTDMNILRVMLLKEIRTTLRERAQILRMTMSLVVLSLILGNSVYRVARPAGRGPVPQQQSHSGQSAPAHAAEAVGTRWAAIGGAVLGGFFFSSGYLIAAILACFVGERENRTLEILLASPLSDAKLFLLKSASVLIPGALLGTGFAIVGIVGVGAIVQSASNSMAEIFLYGLLGLPALILIQTCVVGLGAAISVKAESMKGAGQTLGAVMTLVILGTAYGLPMLLRSNPSWQLPLAKAMGHFSALLFSVQYLMVLAGLASVAIILMGTARVLFRRDRMLV